MLKALLERFVSDESAQRRDNNMDIIQLLTLLNRIQVSWHNKSTDESFGCKKSRFVQVAKLLSKCIGLNLKFLSLIAIILTCLSQERYLLNNQVTISKRLKSFRRKK